MTNFTVNINKLSTCYKKICTIAVKNPPNEEAKMYECGNDLLGVIIS